MTAEEVRVSLSILGLAQTELAEEWDVNPRTVRRWCSHGCSKHIGVCFDAMIRLKNSGMAWRKGMIAISFDGPLTDRQAVERHRRIMAGGI